MRNVTSSTSLRVLWLITSISACGGRALGVGSGDAASGDDARAEAGVTDSRLSFDAGDGARNCSPLTCPSGCCDANGCTTGDMPTACGFGGQACIDCTAVGFDCIPPLSGETGGACGALVAGPGDGGMNCGPANCVGCCAASVCLPGTSNDDCGSHGLACLPCRAASLSCVAQRAGGACVGSATSCNPETCTGCCDASGQCQNPSTVGACGAGGVACEFCLPGQVCNAGHCQTVPGCGPNTCPGCCTGTMCLTGSQDKSSCGSAGMACQGCGSGASCFALGAKLGGTCAIDMGCGPGTCSNGCCDSFYQCQPGNTRSFCASDGDGGSCGTCGGDCSTGVCVGGAFCSPANCINGCCLPDGTCWNGGEDNAHCGGNGALCIECGPGYACNSQAPQHTCTVACSPQNCQGCCVGGICATGTDPTSCGVGGSACVPCGPGQSCVNGACLKLSQCGATLCAGCCDSSLVCHTGTGDVLCGTGGNTCQNCSAGGLTCKAGVCSP